MKILIVMLVLFTIALASTRPDPVDVSHCLRTWRAVIVTYAQVHNDQVYIFQGRRSGYFTRPVIREMYQNPRDQLEIRNIKHAFARPGQNAVWVNNPNAGIGELYLDGIIYVYRY